MATNKLNKLGKSLEIAAKLSQEEHARIIRMVIDCIGMETLECLAKIICQRTKGQPSGHQFTPAEVTEMKAAITAMLLALYLNQCIIFRE